LHLLSRLSFALHDPGFKGAITRQASRDEIVSEIRRVESLLSQPAPAQEETR
jgi:hypothetical protein